jgi:hypothetical protein
MQPATQNDIKRLEQLIESQGGCTQSELTRLEVLWEHDREELRGMFNDIMDHVKKS